MGDRKSALMWAIAWWFARRWMRRRATMAVAGLAAGAGATAKRGRVRAVLASVALVGLLAGAFVVWRRLAAQPEPPSESPDGPAPTPGAPVPTAAA
jgi:hypothetical protein